MMDESAFAVLPALGGFGYSVGRGADERGNLGSGPFSSASECLRTGLRRATADRLPELFCGFPRFRARGPTLYPVASAPQAWSSGAFFALLQTSLGVEQDPFANVIRFRNPKLPAFLDSVVLRGLKAGTGSVDLSVQRHGDDNISLRILERRGDIEVTTLFSE